MAGNNKRILFITLFLFGQATFNSFAREPFPFQGKINKDNINIRSDSTVNSEAICSVNKGDSIEVVSELYDWYKVRLPKEAPSFIKKELVELIDESTAKVSGDIVNIRLKADEASPVLGKAKENEIVNILGENGAWLKIEPINNSFGWVHKNFVKKTVREGAIHKPLAKEEIITVEGTIKPKMVTGLASHKLITRDKTVFLLKGNKASLNAFNSRKAKIIGKIIPAETEQQGGAPLLEIIKMEALD